MLYLFLFESFCILIGFSSFLSIFLFYKQSRKRSALYLSQFYLGIFLILMNDWFYTVSTQLPEADQYKFIIFYSIFTTPSLFFIIWGMLLFLFSIFGREITTRLKVLIITLCIVFTTLSVLIRYMFILPFILLVLFTIPYAIRNYKNIGEKMVRKGLKGVVILTILHTPVFLFYFIGDNHSIVIIWHNLYLLTLSIGSISFGLKYFLREPYLENNKPTEFFINKFSITEREVEIISRIILGEKTKDIADKLCISPKTVTNHISNIYIKTEVKSRVQLINQLNNNSVV